MIALTETLDLPPCEAGLAPDEVLRRLRRLAEVSHRCDATLAYYLRDVEVRRLHDLYGHPDTRRFAEAMLDVGRDKTYRLLRAARACEKHPVVRDAFERGEISYGKVDEIARLSRGDDIERWLDLAREKPRDVLREGIDRDERFLPPDGPNRIIRFEVEADQWNRIQAAIEKVRRVGGAEVGLAEAFDVIAHNYLETLLDESEVLDPPTDASAERDASESELRGASEAELVQDRLFRQDVLQRYGWICAIPGCGCRVNLEVDHIVPRSRAPERRWDPDNVAPLCRGHHRLKTDGIIEISGKAPDGTLIVERPRESRDRALV